ncbi:MAG: OapA family protein [Thiohalomonadaceae bacterium]
MSTPTISNRDFERNAPRRRVLLRRPHFHLALGASVAIAVTAVFALSPDAQAKRAPALEPLVETISLPPAPAAAAMPPEPSIEIPSEKVVVRPGDSMAAIFARLGLAPATLHAVMQSGPEARELNRLHPGQELEFRIQDGELRALHYTIDRTRTLAVRAEQGAFMAEMAVVAPEMRIARAVGTIESSLYAAGIKAGLSEPLIMQLAGIFGWDIDFALDIRAGDRFTLIYQEPYVNGERYGEGTILAAEFVNDGRVHRAIRYTDPSGHTDYYSEDGRSMRKAFLRSPVDFHRISSRFTKERYHPVLGVKRPHRGVDYAAPIGTPVKASGDGKVLFVGTKGGYGRTVILQHGGHISTLYGHLSRFAKGLRNGARVRQGQTIGYVGKTGVATGPHLHYEFRVNGVHRNPLTYKLPSAAPIQAEYRQNFETFAGALVSQLELITSTQLATLEP